MADEAEIITLEVDPSDAIKGATAGNAALDAYGKKAQSAIGAASKAFEEHSGVVVRTSDRTRNSVERLIASYEKKAAVVGKSGIDRDIAMADQLIKRLGGEKDAVDRVIAAREKLLAISKAQQAADAARFDVGIGGLLSSARKASAELRAAQEAEKAVGSGFNLRYAFFGVKDIMEGRTKFALAEAANEMTRLQGAALKVGASVAGVAALGVAAYEVAKGLKEIREEPDKIERAFARAGEPLRRQGDELLATNAHLEATIAKLEHRPENGLKVALYDARVEADKLAESLTKDLDRLSDLLEKNRVSTWHRILGAAGTSDIEKTISGLSTSQDLLMGQFNEAMQRTKTPAEVKALQSDYGRRLQNLYTQAQSDIRSSKEMAPGLDWVSSVLSTISGQTPNLVLADSGARQKLLGKTSGYLQELMAQAQAQIAGASLKDRRDQLQAAKESIFGYLNGKPVTFDEFLNQFTEAQNKRYQAAQSASTKMFSGATTLSRAGQYNPNVSPEVSEALNNLDVSTFNRFLLPSFYLPHRQADSTRTNEFADWWKGYQEDQRKEDQRHLTALEKQQNLELQIAKIHSGGDEVAAIQRAYQMRLDYAQQIYEVEKKTAGETAAHDRLESSQTDAQIQRALEMAQLEQKRFDAISKQSSALYETLFTNPRQFGPQLGRTLRGAALRPVTEGLGNLTASFLYPLFYGGKGGGINDVHLIDGAVPVHIVGMGGRSSGGGAAVVNNSFTPMPTFSPIGGFDGAAAVPFGGDAGFSPLIRAIGPGGTPGFAPGKIGLPGFGGGGIFNRGGLTNVFGNIRGLAGFGDIQRAADGGRWAVIGDDAYNVDTFGGKLSAFSHSQLARGGAGMLGGMLANVGLLGSERGTAGGVFEGMLGGAGIGFALGGPLGAAIGAGAGLLAGVGEMIAGVESPQHEAARLIRQIYGVSLPERGGAIQQIVNMAQQYGGSISMAVRTSEVRRLIELYALSTGQRSGAFLDTPHSASLIQANGKLYQGPTYFNGTGYTYGSPLPTLGYSAGAIPTADPYAGPQSGPQPVVLDRGATMDLWRYGTAMAISGSPRAVAASANAGYGADASRLNAASAILAPSVSFV